MKVKSKSEPKNVKISGPGLEKSVPASLPAEFIVDTKNAGIGDLDITILVLIHSIISVYKFEKKY
jgi:hypothetical protein